MDTKFTSFAMDAIPHALRERVALVDGVLHWSGELKGHQDLDKLAARLRRRGITRLVMHTPSEFNKDFAASAMTGKTENEVQQQAVELIATARKLGASDIHITHYGPYALIGFRRLGMMQDYTQLYGEQGIRLIQCMYQTMSQSSDTTFSPSERQDGRIARRDYLPADVHSVRLHTEPIQSIHSLDGTGTYLAMRLLYDATHASGTLHERVLSLGFTAQQCEALRSLTQCSGLNIISGPTGHGKTTLLKQVMESMVEEMPEKNYMSIEDPPEYPLPGVKQIPVSTKALDEEERERRYAAAIAGLMRSDLDVGMIGEIRYGSAAHAAIEAALTGHGIWATVHASNALAIISRFREMGISLNSLCNQNVLSGLTYQRLLPLLCPECKVPLLENTDTIPKAVWNRLTRLYDDLDGIYVRGEGCPHCDHLGMKGQTVAAEVITIDHQMLRYLREEELLGAQQYWVKECGGMTYIAHALQLVNSGLVDPHTAEVRLGVTLDYDDTIKRLTT